MQFVSFVLSVMLLSAFLGAIAAGPLPRSEIPVQALQLIPQSHCLRYFKHDMHPWRRCRNHRVPMLRKANHN